MFQVNRQKRRWTVCTNLFICVAAIFFAGIWSGPAGAETLTFRLAWIKTSTNAGPYYYAKAKGLFKAEGLDVDVKEGKGSATSVKLVAAGDSFIASADYGTAIKSMVKGIPVKGIFGEFQVNPMSVLSLASKPIKTPQDLIGKNLVSCSACSYTLFLPVLCKNAGIDCSQINLRFARPPFQRFLHAGQVDGFLGYFSDNVPKLEMKAKAHALMYKDYGVKLMSNGLIASRDTLKNNGDAVRRFLRATGKAWKAARDNRNEVVEVWMKVIGRGKKELYTKILTNAVSLLHTPNNQGKPLGWMAEQDWNDTQNTMVTAKQIEKKMPVSDYYTNDFIADIM
jgi:NitT/TauT family transport system substrate-binding protein